MTPMPSRIPPCSCVGAGERHLFADISRRIGVGNVLADHLQGDVVRPQGIAGHLYGTEERHGTPSCLVVIAYSH